MDKIAALSNNGEITIFSYADKVIRFRTSRHLVRYTKVLEGQLYIEIEQLIK